MTSHRSKRVILIGSLSRGDKGAIPTITREFIKGLEEKYTFVPHRADRTFGLSHQGKFNVFNVFYFVKHFAGWVVLLIRFRPHVAHYPVTSYWNLEKSLAFIGTARLAGSRTIGHLHGGAFIDFWHTLPQWRKRFARARLKQLNAFVVLSDGWKDKIKQEIGLPDARIHVVRNLLQQETESSLLSLHIPHPGKRVLCMGVMSRQKGLYDILDAAEIVLPTADLVFDFVGPDREPGAARQCRSWGDEHGVSARIAVHGAVWNKQRIAELYRDAGMLILPSYHENLPLVILEAAAAGLPIIATPVGALPEFFHHERSILFIGQGDTQELARRIRQLSTDEPLRTRLGTAARSVFAECFNRESVLSSLDAVYRAVLTE